MHVVEQEQLLLKKHCPALRASSEGSQEPGQLAAASNRSWTEKSLEPHERISRICVCVRYYIVDQESAFDCNGQHEQHECFAHGCLCGRCCLSI